MIATLIINGDAYVIHKHLHVEVASSIRDVMGLGHDEANTLANTLIDEHLDALDGLEDKRGNLYELYSEE